MAFYGTIFCPYLFTFRRKVQKTVLFTEPFFCLAQVCNAFLPWHEIPNENQIKNWSCFMYFFFGSLNFSAQTSTISRKVQKLVLFLWPFSVWHSGGQIFRYSNIFGQIYSFILIFIDFYQDKYIWILIRHQFILKKIFGYHSSDIYDSKFLLLPKNGFKWL